MKNRNAGAGGKRLLIGVFVFAALVAVTVYFAAIGSDGVFAPMLTADLIFLSIWLFKPADGEGKAAYYAIIATGIFNIILSVALSILVPVYGTQWGFDTHPDDLNGITYPAVNDGRENCIFYSILFLFYYGFAVYQRMKVRKMSNGAVARKS